MKKLLIILASSLYVNVVLADGRQCISVTNYSDNKETVTISTIPETGITNNVPFDQTGVLSYDEISNCYPQRGKSCIIYIVENSGSGALTQINDVPNGTNITYYNPSHYVLNESANVQCK